MEASNVILVAVALASAVGVPQLDRPAAALARFFSRWDLRRHTAPPSAR